MTNGFKFTGGFINNHGIRYVTGVTTLNGQDFMSNSGGGGKGPIPTGTWKIGKVRSLELTPDNIPMTMHGVAFFCPLIPMFDTDRTDIGIHPDGGYLGTMGCNGIMEKFSACYYLLQELEGQEFIVTDETKK